jgi:hypothetical protein
MAHQAGMAVRYLGDWQRPRDQNMLGFTAVDRTRDSAVHV